MTEKIELGYVIAYVPDVAQALAFYERAFGFARRMITETGEYGELETGATRLSFANESNAPAPLAHHRPDQPPAATEIALVSRDVARSYRRALDAGAKTVSEPAEKPWGQTVAYVRDPNGILVELCSPMG